MNRRWLLTLLLALAAAGASAQKYPERREIRHGNRQYAEGEYAEAELSYMRALEKTPASVAAQGNLGGALYKQERYDEAAQGFHRAAVDTTAGGYAPQLFYNEGNALLKQRKIEEAIEAYKNALRRNPDDQEAKFNLAYAQKMRQKNDQDGGGGGGENDQDKDQNQNKDQDQDKDQKDQDQNKDQDQKKDRNQPQNQQPRPQGALSPQEAQQMLDAMQAAEDNTKKKVDAQKAQAVGRSGKNW